MLLDIDLVARIGQRADARPHGGFKPRVQELRDCRRATRWKATLIEFGSGRRELRLDLSRGLPVEVLATAASKDGGAPLSIRFAPINAAVTITRSSQSSSLQSTYTQSGNRGCAVAAPPLALWLIHLTKRSRGMRTDLPRRMDGISARAAKSRTLTRLIDSNLPASSASRRRGRSDSGSRGGATALSSNSVNPSMSRCSVPSSSCLAFDVRLGETDGPVSPKPLSGRPVRSRMRRWEVERVIGNAS